MQYYFRTVHPNSSLQLCYVIHWLLGPTTVKNKKKEVEGKWTCVERRWRNNKRGKKEGPVEYEKWGRIREGVNEANIFCMLSMLVLFRNPSIQKRSSLFLLMLVWRFCPVDTGISYAIFIFNKCRRGWISQDNFGYKFISNLDLNSLR